ncbi:Arginine--tRNA ligase [bacterium HR19]|nr:Arginine--tRNA ligase [bacterium HR19]
MNQKTIGERIKEKIEEFLKDRNISLEVPNPERPKNEKYGELFTDIAFKLSPLMKKPPHQIAEEISTHLKEFNPQIVNGFVNFKIPSSVSLNFIMNYERPKILEGKRVLAEFVSANPTGPLHIGHGRIAAVGNALSRIAEFCGAEVEKEFYINDAGEQIEKLGKAIKGEGEEYKGKYIEDVREKLRKEIKDFGSISDYELGFNASRIILEDIKKTLERFGIKFRRFISEREITQKLLKEALEVMKDYLYEKDGAVFLKTTQFGDEKDRVVIKSDKKPTYFGNDCAYHLDKIKRKYDILFQVWGADHHGYIKRIESFLRIAGFQGEFIVKLVQMVNLIKDGKSVQMSKREGTYITLDELLDEVGEDAAKFIYLTRNCDTPLDFDIDMAKRKSFENPVYYVQYTHARACSLFREAENRKMLPEYQKWKEKLKSEKKTTKIFDEEEERNLLALCSVFYDEVIVSCKLWEPSRITSFLLSLASAFHSFYQRKRILTDEEETSFSRMFISEIVKEITKKGLSLLGVSAPERM